MVPWNKGRKEIRPEVIKKLSESHKGIKQSRETILKRISKVIGRKNSEFSKALMSKRAIERGFGKAFGPENPKWIKDRSLIKHREKRNNPEYKQWRYQVYKRDRYTCRVNRNCSGKLVAHHILPWRNYIEERYNINNGITLCQAHHPVMRSEEKRLAPFFQELVSVSN